jgi:multidrug resistance efflux pump
MLDISKNSIKNKIDKTDYSVFKSVFWKPKGKLLRRLLLFILITFLITLFIPWTQNITSQGFVTTLSPNQRPQTINSIIAGRLEKWYVKEGDFVKAGDTIVFISETKAEYFDPELVDRTDAQVQLKGKSITSYENKISALSQQLGAFQKIKILKLQQAQNKFKQSKLKVKADSVDFIAYEKQFEISETQFIRTDELYKKGLKSLKELEQANLKVQESMAKAISQENKLLVSRNEVINAMIEISNIQNEFLEKTSKVESDQFSVISDKLDAASNKVKLQNQLKNYQVRQGLYAIKAPIDGYITKLIRSGIGETVKEGEVLLSIAPAEFDLAVEFFINPIDYPLVHKGEKVRLQFDGWPAIVFSGWPNSSFGTFHGEIYAIDNFTSSNGKFRVMAIPDKRQGKWPNEIRVGSGVKSFTLLNDVPIWYELWRKLNGFPPEYYENPALKSTSKSGK